MVPYVSSFSHRLPGSGSYMSVHRVFQVPRGHPQATPNLSSSSPFHPGHLGLFPEQQRASSSEPTFNPFDPRFKIPRVEATDEEWEETLAEVFEESGLLQPGTGLILRQVPKGLVNINFDVHTCVHMGTEIDPEESTYPPTAISYPSDEVEADAEEILHTLVLMDVDLENRVHWMVTNIPGAKVNKGKTVATYASPNPGRGTGTHRYVVVVMEQTTGEAIADDQVATFKSDNSCDLPNRENFDLQGFRAKLQLSEPVAANYFTEEYTSFVDNIDSHCLAEVPLQPHPLHR